MAPIKKPIKKGVCPYLVNNAPCPFRNGGCHCSHVMSAIRWWQENQGKLPCSKGPKCSFLLIGKCLWSHPEEDRVQAMEHQRVERTVEVTDGLIDLQLVTADHLEVFNNFTGITNFRELASFNKVADDEIAVPGCPPRFSRPMQPLDIPEDSTNEAINTAYPKFTHPFEPLLRSVEAMQPAFDTLGSADVVSNAGNLRKLFDLLCNDIWMLDRYDVEVRGTTLLLSRWNGDPDLARSNGRGCGFERETCRYAPDDDPAVQRSASHHRVLAYDFGGLQCVVQAEVDAYCCGCDHSGEPTTPTKTDPTHTKHDSDALHVLPLSPGHLCPPTSFSALTLDDPGDSPTFTAAKLPFTLPPSPPLGVTFSPTLRIHRIGRHIPSHCLVEVKTQNACAPPRSTHEAQLYFARRSKLYLAKHRQGVFTAGRHTKVQDKQAELKGWEAREQATLQKLAALLVMVRNGVQVLGPTTPGGISLVCECDGSGRDEGVSLRFCARVDGQGGGLLP